MNREERLDGAAQAAMIEILMEPDVSSQWFMEFTDEWGLGSEDVADIERLTRAKLQSIVRMLTHS